MELQSFVDKDSLDLGGRQQDRFLMKKDAQILCNLRRCGFLYVDQGEDQRLLLRIVAVLVEIAALRKCKRERHMIAIAHLFRIDTYTALSNF